MDPTRVSKDESEANRAIEYYKKYSLNPDLIKYFTGPEASFVDNRTTNYEVRNYLKQPQHVSISSNIEREDQNTKLAHGINEASCKSQEGMQSPAFLDIEINQIVELVQIEEKNHSRSSSVESNKIEWDNGADIGYSNSYKLSTKKSASFPSVFTSDRSVKSNDLPTVTQEKSITDNIKELRKMYNQLTFSSDTSNSTNKEYDSSLVSKEQTIESSPLQETQNVKSSTQSSSGDNYIHKKIGNPIAYSTPHEGSSSKESDSRSSHKGASSSKESMSGGSAKYDVYTVTPMLTMPVTKRILNNDIPLNLPQETSKKKSNDGGHNVNSLNQNVMRQKVDKIHKNINLCLTKPISVECISLETKKSVHKVVQTSFSSDKSSKCVQTEELQLENKTFEPVIVCTPLTQKIEYVRFNSQNSQNESDRSKTSSEKLDKPVVESSTNTRENSNLYPKSLRTSGYLNLQGNNSKTTQTDSVILQKAVRNRKTTNDTKGSVNVKSEEVAKVARSRKIITYYDDSTEISGSVNSSCFTSDDKTSTSGNVGSTEFGYKTADTANEFQTEELLLAEMISLNHSKDLNTDIKRSIDILQKLLRSRKYDEATKKHYIKKIVQKIVDSKYSDDSTNSDLFRPKKNTNVHKFENKTDYQTQNIKGTTKLMDNKPWYPISESTSTIPKVNSKKSDHTNTKKETLVVEKKLHPSTKNNTTLFDLNVIKNLDDLGMPIQKEIPKVKENMTKIISQPPKEIPTDQNFKQKITNMEKNENFTKKTARFTSNSASRLVCNSSPDKENLPTSSGGKLFNANWKTAKTLSEKLLENRDSIEFRKGQGDYLLNVVKNERYHQLSWINEEIDHLVKLKELLEKEPKSRKADPQLKDVLSSLLQMKVGDMKGLSKNFEVLICKSELTKKKCSPDCGKTKEIRISKKKSASLTPGYYTVETKLDPDGNLVDLTVYDGKGERKYNYLNDGVVDDVSINSKNHNTEVKLKPKIDEYPGLFVPSSNDSDVSLCEECPEDISERNIRTLQNVTKEYKHCKACRKLFVPSSENPNLCIICKNCYEEETQPEEKTTTPSNTKCEACGRKIKVRAENDSELRLCKDCEKKLVEKGRRLYQQSFRTCRVCGERFLVPKGNGVQNICAECSQFVQQAGKRCPCQNVTFNDPLKFDMYRCVTKNLPGNEQLWNVVTKSVEEKSGKVVEGQMSVSQFCPACEKHLSQCMCGTKFLPKTPKLVGTEVEEKFDVSHQKEQSSTIRQKSKSTLKKAYPAQSTRGSSTQHYDPEIGSVNPVQKKKSCQCCTCADCSVQTKKLGDKNVRCQCRICENCGIQVSMDGKGRQKKVNNSKCCQSTQSNVQNYNKITKNKSEINYNVFNEKKSVNRKKDELDQTDESLQNIASGTIICITPTKYKNKSNEKSDSECQCLLLKSRSGYDTDHHKSLQDHHSVLKVTCKSVSTMPDTQEPKQYICSVSCAQDDSDRSRSCESLEYPCKPLKPKTKDPRENLSELSLTCPSKKTLCPAKPPTCPGFGNKPCPAYPAKQCRNLKSPSRDDRTVNPEEKSSEASLTCPSEKALCPANPPPCPGAGKPCPAYPPKPCPTRNGSSLRKKENFRYADAESQNTQENDSILLPISINSPSPLQRAQRGGDQSSRAECSCKELQTPEETPPRSSNSPANSAPTHNRQPNIELYLYSSKKPTNARQNISEGTKCSCSSEPCKCTQTNTHEEKYIQCPVFRQCACQTEPKEDAIVQCNNKGHEGMICDCDKIIEDKENLCPREKTSLSSSRSNSSSDSYMSCICCKKQKILKNLIDKVPLCEPCQEVNQNNFYPHDYSNPMHSCLCYRLVNCDILYQFKKTLTELERLEIYQQYCEVLKNCKCCKKCGCKCKLPKRFKNGCAYFLKLEDACPGTHCERERVNSDSLHYEEGEDNRENCLPEVTVKVPNCKGSCARLKKNGKETKTYTSCPSIQNYLYTMKPDFVERAERRRRILKYATSQREENSDNRKLKFIEKINCLNQRKRNGKFSCETDVLKPGGDQMKAWLFDIELNESPKKMQPRIFKSFKEMKDLTRRKYLHLSEVKNKKIIHREKRLREANRLLANTFTRRLQRSTLRGAVDIPLNVKVVSY